MQPDPRFEAVLNLIRSGEFGWEGYFAQLIDSLNGSSDYYLLANDFPSYLEAQVRLRFSQEAAGLGSVHCYSNMDRLRQGIVSTFNDFYDFPQAAASMRSTPCPGVQEATNQAGSQR